jgi:Na+-transporting NADH:ubiquinone oxidoreductase subunit D
MKSPPMLSFMDGIGNGLGYSFVLVVVGVIKELFGFGTLLGFTIIPTDIIPPNGLLVLPFSSFFVIGLFIWVLRVYKKDQVEPKE